MKGLLLKGEWGVWGCGVNIDEKCYTFTKNLTSQMHPLHTNHGGASWI